LDTDERDMIIARGFSYLKRNKERGGKKNPNLEFVPAGREGRERQHSK